MDYGTGYGQFGIPIEFTLFIPITTINENNGGTEIWPEAYLGKEVHPQTLEKFEKSIIVTNDIANVYAISANIHHRGLRNRSELARDIISIKVSSGIPCDLMNLNEPCHIGKHHLTFGASVKNRERSSKIMFQALDMMLSDQKSFILELRGAVSFKRHRAMHQKLKTKPTIKDYLEKCNNCVKYETTDITRLERHVKIFVIDQENLEFPQKS